jgi:hypothetical protein
MAIKKKDPRGGKKESDNKWDIHQIQIRATSRQAVSV